MSLLREAEKCLANQKTFANLNAFITPLERSTSWRERLRDADARRTSGRLCASAFPRMGWRFYLLISSELTLTYDNVLY